MNFAETGYPIARSATLVRHGNHHDFVFFDRVDDAVGKVVDAKTTRILFDTPANTRMFAQQTFDNHNFPAKVAGG